MRKRKQPKEPEFDFNNWRKNTKIVDLFYEWADLCKSDPEAFKELYMDMFTLTRTAFTEWVMELSELKVVAHEVKKFLEKQENPKNEQDENSI